MSKTCLTAQNIHQFQFFLAEIIECGMYRTLKSDSCQLPKVISPRLKETISSI